LRPRKATRDHTTDAFVARGYNPASSRSTHQGPLPEVQATTQQALDEARVVPLGRRAVAAA
jgi:hypothetical protein